MSPREFDPATIQRRLALIRRLLTDLAAAGPLTQARMAHDAMLGYGVERILTQLVDLAVAINGHIAAAEGHAPEDYRSSFGAAARVGVITAALADRLAPSAGLRNVLVHDYLDTDMALVVSSTHTALEDYGAYCRQVAQWLASQ